MLVKKSAAKIVDLYENWWHGRDAPWHVSTGARSHVCWPAPGGSPVDRFDSGGRGRQEGGGYGREVGDILL